MPFFMSTKLQAFSLLLLTLSLLTFTSFSSAPPPLNKTNGFKRWVTWNAQSYKKTTTALHMNPNSQKPDGGGGGRRALDTKLAKAEAAAVRYSVCQDGSGDYRSLREAIDDTPLHNSRRVILVIKPGIYREKIVIPKAMSFITLLGIGESPPTITGNDTAATGGSDGKPLKTFHSPTVAVNADYFVAANIRFENVAPTPKPGRSEGRRWPSASPATRPPSTTAASLGHRTHSMTTRACTTSTTASSKDLRTSSLDMEDPSMKIAISTP